MEATGPIAGTRIARLSKGIADILPRCGREGLAAVFITPLGPIFRLLALGPPGRVEVRARELVSEAVRVGAFSIVLAHNHPSQDSRPSRQDIEATKRLKRLLEALDIELLDHWIFVASHFRSLKTGELQCL